MGAFVGSKLWAAEVDHTHGFEPFYGAPANVQLVADVNATPAILSGSSPTQIVSDGSGDLFFTALLSGISETYRLTGSTLTLLGTGATSLSIANATNLLLCSVSSGSSAGGAWVEDRLTGARTKLPFSYIFGRNVLALPDGSFLSEGSNPYGYELERATPGGAKQVVGYPSYGGGYFQLAGSNVVQEVNGELSFLPLNVVDSPIDLGPSSDLAQAVTIGSQLYYISNGALRVTDGTLAGTQVLVDGTTIAGSAFATVVRAGSTFYLLTKDHRLFASDGTTNGTHVVAGALVDSNVSASLQIPFGDRALYRQSNQLWIASADGTATMLSDLPLSNPTLTTNGGIAAIDGTNALALATLPDGRIVVLRTDGTVAGTNVDAVLNIAAGAPTSLTPQLAAAGVARLFHMMIRSSMTSRLR